MRMSTGLCLAALVAALAVPSVSKATVYDAASAFSPTSNPSGVWSYGFSATLGGVMILDPERANDNGLDVWRTNIWLGAPAVFHNGTSHTITNSTGTLVMAAGALGLHPGPSGQYSLLRFTAPADGAYQVAVAFSGLDIVGTTTDVHVLSQGTSLFDGQVNGYGPGPTYSTSVTLKAGDAIDFAVGWGANHEFSWDATGVSVQITSQSSTSTCVMPPAGLVSWWPANGNANDVVGANPGTPVGNVVYTNGRVSQAFGFDGSSYVAVPNSPSLNPTGSFSIECWVYPVQDAPYQQILLGKWSDNYELQNQRSYALTLQPGRAVGFAISDAAHQWDPAFHVFFTEAGAVTLQAWNHIAAVYDQSTGTRRIYINGVKAAERTDAPITVLNSTAPLVLGSWYRAASWIEDYFVGELDEVSFYNRALTADEIQAIYAADGAGKCVSDTPRTACVAPPSGLVSWWRAEGTLLDAANGNNGTPVGNVTFGPGRVGQALVFDGANSAVNLGSPTSLQLQTFTIEAWIKRASLAQVSLDPGGTAAGTFYSFGPGGYGFQVATNGVLALGQISYGAVRSTASGITDTNWHHVAVSKSGSTVTFYLDGALNSQVTYDPGFTLTTPVLIGAWPWGSGLGNCFLGSIDELAVYNRALTTEEIHSLYAADGAGKCFSMVAAAPVITNQPANQVASVGASVKFSVGASGTRPMSYQWRFNATPLSGQTTDALSLSNVQLTHAGSYSVVVSNLAGSVTSASALLTVNVTPTCTPSPSGLVSWWRAEGNALDSAGTHNGTLSGGATFNQGEVGQGFVLNGTDASVNLGDWFKLPVFSVALWVNPGAWQQTYADLIDNNHSDQPYRSWTVQYQNTGLRFAWAVFSVNSGFAAVPFDLKADTWQYLVLTLDTNRVAQVYVDGQLQGSTNLSGAVTYDGTEYLRLGRWGGGGRYFNGLLDEVDVYNRALVPTEIQALYASGSAGKCFTPVAPTITTPPLSQVANVGLNAAFNVAASGTQPLSYQWFFNGTKLNGKTTTSLSLTNVQLTDAGTYSAVVSNLAGTASAEAVLTVTEPVCVTPPSGLVSWWRAQSNALDSVNGNNGSLAGNATYGPGRAGQAFVFDGANDGVQLGNPANLQLQVFTVEAWVKRASTTRVSLDTSGNAGGTLYSYGPAGYGFQLAANGRLALGKISYSAVVSPAAGVTDTNWHHVAVSKNGSAVTFYLDGAFNSRVTYEPGFVLNTPVTIGAWGPGLGNCFLGAIDELAVYNRALTTNEIQALYLATVTGKCTTPPSIVTQPASRSIIEGSNATFSVTAAGNPVLHYQWLFNGTNLAGATGTSLTLSQAQWTNAGSYSVLVANAFGAAVSSNAVLAVDRIPVAQCATVVVAAGADCTANASVDQGSFDPDNDPLTVSQTPPGPYPLGTNLVTLTVTDNHGASNACTALVVVLDQTSPTLLCPADLVVTNAHDAWTSVVTYAATASDNCSGVGQPVCDPPSGTAFGLGTHTVNCSVADAAGNVAHGSFKVTVLSGNVPPVPVIEVQPLAHFPGRTNLLVISPDSRQATVVLDGSRSYDVDDASFLSLWYGGTNLLGTNLVSTCVLGLGTSDLTLWLDDTYPLGTNSASVAVEVLSPMQAVAIVAGLLQNPPGSHPREFLASLGAAQEAFKRRDFTAGLNELCAFQHKVSVQVAPQDPALADALIQAAQQIINALTPTAAPGHAQVKFQSLTHQQGKLHLKFAGIAGKVHLVQASTNMVDWQTIGTATDLGNGSFDFEDAKAVGVPARFYRIVAP